MKWRTFSILTLTLIILLVCCTSCGTNTTETTDEQEQSMQKSLGPNKIIIHFNRLTHEIEKVIVTGQDQQKKCPELPPTANLEAAQQAAKDCFVEEYSDPTEIVPGMEIDIFTVNPTYCVIYDARGNRYFVPCP